MQELKNLLVFMIHTPTPLLNNLLHPLGHDHRCQESRRGEEVEPLYIFALLPRSPLILQFPYIKSQKI